MILVFDVGNSNITAAVFCNRSGVIVHRFRLKTDAARTGDELGAIISQILVSQNIIAKDITGVMVGSVVPPLVDALAEMAERCFDCTAFVLGRNIKAPVKTHVDEGEIGADILANIYAAYLKFKQAMIVIDFGTATTFDLMDDKGGYHGTSIAPGIALSIRALAGGAALLPSVKFEQPEKVVGKNTIDCMKSGLFYGYVAMTEGMIDRIRTEVGQDLPVVATGGFAPLIANATDRIAYIEPDLTLYGLYQIYRAG